MQWTLDTCVLYRAKDDLDAMDLLLRVRRNRDKVCLDHEGCIKRQYENCLRGPRSELLRKWFKVVVDKLAIFRSGKLDRRHGQALDGLEFDRDDWPFVAVCGRTESRKLVSEDSDYSAQVTDYLAQAMGISVLAVEDAVKLCD